MVKASALYIVIIIALVIGLLCSSLIVAAYYYRAQYQAKARYYQLKSNLNSGVNILLASTDAASATEKALNLFEGQQDSISMRKISWGVFDIGVVKAFIQKDTLYKTFLFANAIDSTKWAALYLIDEDRPFSLSGKTTIRGDAYIPKAGVQTAYVDNKSYDGDKRLIIGTKHNSERKLPAMNDARLSQFAQFFDQDANGDTTLTKADTISNSFLHKTHIFNFKKKAQTIENTTIQGNIILLSDTTITIDSTSTLKNVQVYARAIVVKSGFHGNCQLFATDSIRVEANCNFSYPSCLGVVRFKNPVVNSQPKLSIGKNSTFYGLIFTYDKLDNPVKPLILVGNDVKIKGQVFSYGIMQMNDKSEVDGSLFTSRFWYRSTFTLYENYLINSTIDAKALSSYYLSSDLIPVVKKRKKVLQWLEAN
jgi:hypothetical protein